MINKKSLWFLTLFSLILVLSVYYITMPSEMLLTTNADYNKEAKKETEKEETKKETTEENSTEVEESEIVVALRVEADEETQKEMDTLKETLTNDKATSDEKNNAFEKLKVLNEKKAEEEKLEKSLLEKFKFKNFVKIDGDQVTVVVASDKHDVTLANNIMRAVQENYDTRMYVTVKFNTKE